MKQPRVCRTAEKAAVLPRPAEHAGVPDMFRQREGCRKAIAAGPQLLHDSADAGPIVGRAGFRILRIHRQVRYAGQHPVAARRVSVVVGGDGPQDAELVEQPRGPWHQFADLNARHVAGDGPEITANLGRGVRLGVPGFVLGRTAEMKQDDAGLGLAESALHRPGSGGSLRTCPQQHRQGQTKRAQTADAQPLPPSPAIAETRAAVEEA